MTYRQIFERALAAAVAVFLAVPASMRADVTIDSVTFPDANFRNWILAQDYGSDGILTEQEMASVTSIYVDGRGISYLVGIEYFTGLRDLSCENNQLRTLNLRKNTQLTTFRCTNNHIEYLDLTQNDHLEYLIVTGNLLTSVQLNENAPLTHVNVDRNSIRGESMDALIAQLPVVSSGSLVAVQDRANYYEQNVITAAQVAAAHAKGWKVEMRKSNNHSAVSNYEGREPLFYAVSTNVASPHGYFYGAVRTSPPYELVEFEVWAYEGYQPIVSVAADSGEVSIELTQVDAHTYSFRMPFADVTVSSDFGWFINDTHFPDNNFRNFLLETAPGADALLTDAERDGLTHLDVDELSISSLAGIDYLTSLQFLSCDMNSLNSLDVSRMSHLQTLLCGHNSLTKLDLSGNPSLRLLDCSCNRIVGEMMEQLVSSLPTVENGELRILSVNNRSERNEITTEQVETAKAKGWKVFAQTDEGWQDFDEVVTGIGNIKSSHPADAPKYNLKGQPVGDGFKGIVVEEGRKIVVR